MIVVGKFSCQFVGHTYWGPDKTVGTIKLSAVTNNSQGAQEENEKFFEATPSGYIELQTISETALKEFQPGALYKVTLEKVDE